MILDHLAEALLKSGNPAAAIDTWTRAIPAFEKHAEPEKVKQTRKKSNGRKTGPPTIKSRRNQRSEPDPPKGTLPPAAANA